MEMKPIEEKKKKRNTKKTVVLVICAILLLALISAFSFFAVMASTDKIYNGIYVGSVNLGGLSEAEAITRLSDAYKPGEKVFRFSCEGVNFEIYSSQISLEPDFKNTAKNASEFGKNGNIFEKMFAMFGIWLKSENLAMDLKCDYDALKYQISEKLPGKVVDVQQYAVVVGEDCLTVTNGKNGIGADIDKLLSLMGKSYTETKSSEVIKFELETVKPEKIDPEKFYTEYNREPKDAEAIEENDVLTIIPEVVGIQLNKEQTISILNQNVDNKNEYTIPAVITNPEITAAKIEEEYTDTVIGTFSTDYSSSNANRKENIRLASTKINGFILNPGEEFSFNGVVGPRTEETGYKVAHVYSGNKVIDGVGGGICQVSSTLFNAVVLADLEIVYRTNHSMPVSYVPLGRDATVSYGTIDFKFKNNKQTPVKLEAIADGSKLTINVYGRKKYVKDISLETKVLGSVPFSTTEIKDDSMYEDERKVEESGSNGTRTETYKIVRENGEVVSNTLLCKSNYTPTSAVVRVGTKKRPVPAEEPETEPETPASTQPETPAPTQPETPAPTQPETPAPTQPETPAPTQPETPAPTQPETPAPTQPETPPDIPSVTPPSVPNDIQELDDNFVPPDIPVLTDPPEYQPNDSIG